MSTHTSQEASSSHIATLAVARIKASPYQAISQVICEHIDGTLILRGQLGTFFHKQVAQEAVADIEGVQQVLNHIEVVGYPA